MLGTEFSATQQPDGTTTRMSADRKSFKEGLLIFKIGTKNQTPMAGLMADPRRPSTHALHLRLNTAHRRGAINCQLQVQQEPVAISTGALRPFNCDGYAFCPMKGTARPWPMATRAIRGRALFGGQSQARAPGHWLMPLGPVATFHSKSCKLINPPSMSCA